MPTSFKALLKQSVACSKKSRALCVSVDRNPCTQHHWVRPFASLFSHQLACLQDDCGVSTQPSIFIAAKSHFRTWDVYALPRHHRASCFRGSISRAILNLSEACSGRKNCKSAANAFIRVICFESFITASSRNVASLVRLAAQAESYIAEMRVHEGVRSHFLPAESCHMHLDLGESVLAQAEPLPIS